MEKFPQGTGIFYVEATSDSPTNITPITPFTAVENAIRAGAFPVLRYEFGGSVYYKIMTVYTPGVSVNFNGWSFTK